MFLSHSDNYADNIYCEAATSDDPGDLANTLCTAEGGEAGGPTHGEYTLYLLSGNSKGNKFRLRGDVNGDGSVDVVDITTIRNMINGRTEETEYGDVNGDGIIDAIDMTAVVNIIQGRD